MNRNPNDVNKGFDIKRFLWITGTTLAALLIGMVLLVRMSAFKVARHVDSPKTSVPSQ